MPTLSDAALRKVVIALALYLTSLVAANTLGLKAMPFFGMHLSVAVFMFPFVFLTTDVIGEVFGRRLARFFVLAGLISTGLFLAYDLVSLAVPWSADSLWAKESYEAVFGVSLRMAIASIIAFAVAEYQDVYTFFFFKRLWGERAFWLRSLLSNIWSQLLDSVLFMTIAFYGVYGDVALLKLIISWWIFKVAMGFLYTPLMYLGIRALRA